MKEIINKHLHFWQQKDLLINVLVGFLLLFGSLTANNYAQIYTVSHVSNSVTDILLDNIPVFDVHLIFSEGMILLVLFLIILLIIEPKYISLTLKCLALFYLIRSFFIILTHMAPPIDATYIDPTDLVSKLGKGDDMFFSGHTGMPLLFSLIFWDKKILRYIFLVCTVVFGASVIMGHLHYSIDVFSAVFITYGIFQLAKIMFPKDLENSKA
jgi:membrane-associated phospholipid phosphatase